jgi:hypothetical protein
VVHCTWNTFELEDFGLHATDNDERFFNSPQTVENIKRNLTSKLRNALTDVNGGDVYRSVDVIKVVVKQLKGYKDFTMEQAGTLTKSTATAVRQIIDEAAGSASQLCERNDKILGSLYIRTDPATGHKFQVMNSAGKQTNAVLACLSWMNENAKNFVDSRTHGMDESTKLRFFNALQNLAFSTENNLEMITMSQLARDKLTQYGWTFEDEVKRLLAGLILISINKNEQHVKSVAANFRKPMRRRATQHGNVNHHESVPAAETNVQDADGDVTRADGN